MSIYTYISQNNTNPRLTLVGAGPGDPELLTIKGLRAIGSADVIMYDALASEEILEYAKPGVKMIYVGKRLGTYVYKQEEINQLIVEQAFLYGHVVRLKGGDPFVFGRGFEEIEYTRSFGIPCEVVSGVTSSIGVPASIGIPVTSRGFADSFWVLTGTTKAGEVSADLQLAARSNATIVVLMGMSKLAEICELFTLSGKSEIPMAIIQNGTRKNARTVLSTVSEMPEKAKAHQITNPAVIVIGEVVGLHPEFVEAYCDHIGIEST
ncbi:uroporphyrinogen-III C-methyltransferase [Pseudarcicella hirudinis]|uniref:uroporphyrinogen-III C-methyltransferase n=1 Tax=Pseudarcicella hirudinis TaxID=1079859 RepID=A0A1I5XS27_9BACT|nr:uroporphyrinogen-III C-methyltransferase [Pseudarcicella hirudinis]SFQ34762.1 uroporphyrinogen-III C-methyltransferase [Pseudarcicella hirudinis]